MKIIKGDTVKVLIGKDKNRTGEVILSSPKTHTILVKGLNMFKKHIKAQKGQAGGIVEKERELASSKVAVVCPSCKKTTRVAYQVDANGNKTRICRKCKSMLSKPQSK